MQFQRIKNLASHRVRILFTGGEPLMNWDCLISLAHDAITLGKKFGKAVELSLQTNGVLLDHSKLSLLKDLNFRIGVSLDGYDEVSNSLRIFRNGKNSFHSVCSKIGILNSSDISYGILSTITKKNINKIPEYVVWLEKMNCRALKFSWIYNQGRAREKTDLIPSASEGINLMKKLIKMIEGREITNLALVSLLYYLDTLLIFDRPYMCRRSPCGAITSVLSLDTNGDIYPCDCVTGIKDMRLGNILRDTINQIIHNETSSKLKSRSTESVSECKHCPWRLMCSSPCPARSYANHNNWFSLDKNECEISREFYPYLTERIAKSSILLNYWKRYSTSAKVIREIV
jgi:uncharacterized protein